jgi:hypothetical protein
VVLYECETWSLTLKEKHRLRVFENSMLRRMIGSKTDEVTGGCRKVHNEEFHNLYSSPSLIRIVKTGRMRKAYRILMGKPERKRPLGRPRHMLDDNIKMDVTEKGWYGMDLLILLRIGISGGFF